MRLLRPSPRALALVAAGALAAPLAARGAPPPLRRPSAPAKLARAVKAPAPAFVPFRVTVESPGASLGAPNAGRLVGGARLDDSSALRVYPARAARDRRWALPELAGMLGRAADAVAARHPGSVLGLGDLSQRGGGDISLHHSHESGRDADVGFYAVAEAGRGFVGADFVAFRADGRAADGRGLAFDDARNWELVEAWLSDPRARVTHVFVAEHLRARLLAQARRVGAPPALRARAAFALLQPRHAEPHDDHFHVRIACPPRAQGGCVEWPVARRARHRAARGPHPAKPAPAHATRRPPPAARPSRETAPPALRATPARDARWPAEEDAREVVEQTDESGELKIVGSSGDGFE